MLINIYFRPDLSEAADPSTKESIFSGLIDHVIACFPTGSHLTDSHRSQVVMVRGRHRSPWSQVVVVTGLRWPSSSLVVTGSSGH